MKKIIFCISAITIFAAGCNNNKESNTAGIEIAEKNGNSSFTIDGTTIKGNVSTQYFGSNKETDNFSIICQQDEPLTLLQATFANEKNAKTEGLKPKGGSYKVNEGEFDLSLRVAESDKEFIANEKSGGSLKVEGNKMIITDIKLFDMDGKQKVVNAVIAF